MKTTDFVAFLIVVSIAVLAFGCLNQDNSEGDDPPLEIDHRGIIFDGDSTFTVLQYWDNGDIDSIHYTVDMSHYREARTAVQLSVFPFSGMNVMAQKEYIENLKYIRSMKWRRYEHGKAH